MKSVSFLRNTWKKLESKASDIQSNTENINPQECQKPSHPRPSTANNRSLTITVKHTPLEISNATPVDGSWKPSEDYQPPPSPIYDQFTQNRGDLSFIRKDSSHFALDVAYQKDAARRPTSPKANAPTPTSPKTLRHTSGHTLSRSNQPAQLPVIYNDERVPSSPRHPSSPRQTTTSLRLPILPTLPTYQLLPPIDLNYGPGSKYERKLETTGCKCLRSSPQSRHHSQCPRYNLLETSNGLPARVGSDGRISQKTVHAVLDLSLDSSPRSLYHHTGSTPHLPYKDRNSRPTPSEHSYSETSEAENFPLSLFPAPPPLIVRKKIPAPLVLRPMQTSSSHSSRESTPIGTPTTPRFQSVHSPSQSSIASPSKKHFSLRPCASFSPPPFSPPNSPLPSLPMTSDSSRRRSPDHSGRPLRGAQSNANLRDALPFPATHRLTSSEPISDQLSLPIKRSSAKARPETVRGVNDLQAYMELTEPALSAQTSTDAHVQWGYAL